MIMPHLVEAIPFYIGVSSEIDFVHSRGNPDSSNFSKIKDNLTTKTFPQFDYLLS